MNSTELEKSFKYLSSESSDLCWPSQIAEIDSPPFLSPLQFLRDCVTPNRPIILRGAAKSWPAVTKWTDEYLRNLCGKKNISVAISPNGYADAITDGKFVIPEEVRMHFSKFLDIMKNPEEHNGIFYIQKQNSNLTSEFEVLLNDIEPEIRWASEALNSKPDAVNFWMGDSRAITSMHRDHYENIYCVIRGSKKFILHPPTDLPWIPYDYYNVANFKEEDGKFNIVDNEVDPVPWISINPLNPDLNKYPGYANAHRLECTVNAGDILYLPSLWFHHVQQSHGCIAVNYWYDMEYDIKYTYYKFLEDLVNKSKSSPYLDTLD